MRATLQSSFNHCHGLLPMTSLFSLPTLFSQVSTMFHSGHSFLLTQTNLKTQFFRPISSSSSAEHPTALTVTLEPKKRCYYLHFIPTCWPAGKVTVSCCLGQSQPPPFIPLMCLVSA